jgi:hypothetical protein
MTTILGIGAALFSTVALAATANAQTAVSVQFAPFYNGAGNLLNGGYGTYPSGYFAGGDPVQYWNVASNSTGTGNGTPISPITNASLITPTVLVQGTSSSAPVYTPAGITYDSTGHASTLTFSLTGANDNRYSTVGFDNSTTNNGSTGAYSQFNPTGNLTYFLQSGVEAIDGAGTESLTFGGLNLAATYNVYAYVQSLNFAGSQADAVTLGSQTYYLMTDNLTVTSGTQSSATSALNAPVADYVEFTGISGATLATTALTETGSFTGFSGFQVVNVGVAPEPSTWAMMLGGLGILGFCIRRRSLQVK